MRSDHADERVDALDYPGGCVCLIILFLLLGAVIAIGLKWGAGAGFIAGGVALIFVIVNAAMSASGRSRPDG